MNNSRKILLTTSLAAALAACGGGGGGGGGGSAHSTGELNLAITDAPVDGAEHVWVTITGVKLKRTGSDEEKLVKVIGDEITVDLLALSSGTSRLLFTEKLTAGEYQWARFQLSNASIVWEGGGQEDLQLPTQDELKTSGNFSVPSNGVAHYTVDWDLRKSIVEMGNSGNYKLKPVLHLRDDANVGFVEGEVAGSFVSSVCAGEGVPAVYIYAGTVTPDDMGGSGTNPLASVTLSGTYSFYLGMLTPGDYTLAFACFGDTDAPDSNEDLTFAAIKTISVIRGEGTEFEDDDFPFENVLTTM